MYLSLPVARAMTRGLVAPLLSARLPLAVRRRLLDVSGYVTPTPRGTRRAWGALGTVPTELVAAPGADGPHVLLYLHGGGYMVGSPSSHRGVIAHLSRLSGARVYAPHYRLAPEHPFPAGPDDVLAAYRALRGLGHPARRIAVVGDSAGGGLAVTLLLQLRTAGEDLPGSVGLLSPWLDLTLGSPTLATNGHSDAMLNIDMLIDGDGAYRRGSDAPELRPLDADLSGLPPLHVVAGTAEILLGDSDTFVERVEKAGGTVTYRRVPQMWHDFVLFPGMLREADEALEELGAQLRTDCS